MWTSGGKKNYLLVRLGGLKVFWRLRYGSLKVAFHWFRSIFSLRLRKDEVGAEASAFRILARGTYLPIVAAIMIALGARLLEQRIGDITKLRFIHDSFVGRYLVHSLDQDAYVQLLATVAGVTGVFLGLYFTAVSTVIANAYSTVPHDIRLLLIKDRLLNVYVKAVSLLTALAVILLGMSAGGGVPLHLGAPLVVGLSCFAIFAFTQLGRRAFFLSDPTLLSSTLSYELIRWAKRSTNKGWRWRDANFQEHYRKQARKSVSTLVALAKMSGTKTELQGESYSRLLNDLVFTVRNYHLFKSSIPSSSRWFGQKYEHPQWYLTESSALDFASQSDSALQPNEVPDTNWVEDALFGTVFDALGHDANDKNYEALFGKLNGFPGLFEDLGGNWFAAEGEVWCDKVTDAVVEKIIIQKPTLGDARPAHVVAVVDICASLPVSLELGFIKAVINLNISKLREDLTELDWTKDTAPYGLRLPSSTLKALEQIQESAAFEKAARVTYGAPNWYVIEYAFNNLDWALYQQWEQLTNLIDKWYFSNGEKLASAGLYRQAATVYKRALELSRKLDRHTEELKEKVAALREGSKLDFNRPVWDWEEAHVKVGRFRATAIDEMAKLITPLLSEPLDPDLPDFFGEAVHRTGEACYDALLDGDEARFKALFARYFVGILGAFDKVRPQVLKWDQSTAVTWVAEPIIDLFDISGYAYVFAEFHDKPGIWEFCEAIWSNYLSGEGEQLRLKLLSGLSWHYQHLFGVLSPRATLRSNRQIRLEKLLRTLPREEDHSDPFQEPSVQHRSAFIRNIAPSHALMGFTDSIDLFTVKYLMAWPAAADTDFGVSRAKVEEIRRNERQT